MGWAYTFLTVLVGWVFFSFDDLGAGARYLSAMLGGGAGFWDAAALRLILDYGLLLILCAAASTPLPATWFARLGARRPRLHAVLLGALLVLGFALCLTYVVDAGYNPFLYFRF